MSRIRNVPLRRILSDSRGATATRYTRSSASLLTILPPPQWPVASRRHHSLSTGVLADPVGTFASTLSCTISTNGVSKIQTRGFAIKRKNKIRVGTGKPEAMPLMNEHLVKELMARAGTAASSPEQVPLRLVVEEGGGVPPKSEETSLAQAIQTSLDLGLDLVEIDLQNAALPVVRAVQYEAKVYRTNKEKAKKQVKDPASVVKEFRFKARTAEYDMQRKLLSVVDALKKGHKCQIQATCQTKLIKSGVCPEGAAEVMDKILSGVGSEGDALRPPELNPEKTVSTVQLMPRKESKK